MDNISATAGSWESGLVLAPESNMKGPLEILELSYFLIVMTNMLFYAFVQIQKACVAKK